MSKVVFQKAGPFQAGHNKIIAVKFGIENYSNVSGRRNSLFDITY